MDLDILTQLCPNILLDSLPTHSPLSINLPLQFAFQWIHILPWPILKSCYHLKFPQIQPSPKHHMFMKMVSKSPPSPQCSSKKRRAFCTWFPLPSPTLTHEKNCRSTYTLTLIQSLFGIIFNKHKLESHTPLNTNSLGH